MSFTREEMEQGKVNYNYTLQEFPSAEAPGLSVFYKDADRPYWPETTSSSSATCGCGAAGGHA